MEKLNTSGNTLWLIPARGGSKGIPGKNLRPFCGESLVSRAVRMAKDIAQPDDTIFVSTDSREIKKAAEDNGVKIPFLRPDELSTDTSGTYETIIHALDEFKKLGIEFERVVLLQPTSPFRKAEDVEGALKLWSHEVDMVVSVVKAKGNPYFNLFEEDKEGHLKLSKGDGSYKRRQDAPDVWEYNGAVYVMSVKALRNSPMSGFKRIIPFEMPTDRSIDLDTETDWKIAEILFENWDWEDKK